MKKFFLITTITALSLFGATDIVKPGLLNVKVAKPLRISEVPIGSYLGTYEYPVSHRYSLSANVEGFIDEINVKPYMKVKKGQKLLVVKSPKLLDLQSDYIATHLELEFYKKEIQRLEPLASKGVVASKIYLESKNKFEMLSASVAFKKDVLLTYGFSPKKLEQINNEHKPYPYLTLTAPASTTISELHVEVGNYVNQGDLLAKLVDTSECHFEVNMPWRLTQSLKEGEKLFSGEKIFSVFAMSPQINQISQTRGVDMHEEAACKDKAGASLNIAFFKKQKAWKVPSSAVVGSDDGGYIVFKALQDGYQAVKVKLIAQFEGYSYIQTNFSKDEEIAISSVLTLKNSMHEE